MEKTRANFSGKDKSFLSKNVDLANSLSKVIQPTSASEEIFRCNHRPGSRETVVLTLANNQQPDDCPVHNQQPDGSPTNNQQPDDCPVHNQQPDGSPTNNHQPKNSSTSTHQPDDPINNLKQDGSPINNHLNTSNILKQNALDVHTATTLATSSTTCMKPKTQRPKLATDGAEVNKSMHSITNCKEAMVGSLHAGKTDQSVKNFSFGETVQTDHADKDRNWSLLINSNPVRRGDKEKKELSVLPNSDSNEQELEINFEKNNPDLVTILVEKNNIDRLKIGKTVPADTDIICKRDSDCVVVPIKSISNGLKNVIAAYLHHGEEMSTFHSDAVVMVLHIQPRQVNGEMFCALCRINSFECFCRQQGQQQLNVNMVVLGMCGFYFDRNVSGIVCVFCGARSVNAWNVQQNYPDFVRAIFSGSRMHEEGTNVDLTGDELDMRCAYNRRQSFQAVGNLRVPVSLDDTIASGFYYRPHTDTIRCIWCHEEFFCWNQAGQNPLQLHRSSPTYYCNTLVSLLRGENPPPILDPNCRRCRTMSFGLFPGALHTSPIRNARSGFYFEGTSNAVQCSACSVQLHGWNSDGNAAWILHSMFSPHCGIPQQQNLVTAANVTTPHHQHGDCEHIMQPLQPRHALETQQGETEDEPPIGASGRMRNEEPQSSSSHRNQTVNRNELALQTPGLGVTTEKPKHIQYSVKAVRYCSFKKWPQNIRQTPEELATAGFYYLGLEDCVCCFFCGIRLKQWTETDDPWTEHAKHSPTCVYVRQNKGEDFIRGVHSSTHVNEENENIDIPGSGPDSGASALEIPDEYVEKWLRSPAAESVMEMGYPPEMVKSVIKNLLWHKGPEYITGADIMKKLMALEETPGNSCVAFGTENGTVPDEEVEDEEKEEDELEKLQNENEENQRKITCKICEERETGIVFLPCGHFVSCAECGSSRHICPVCSSVIKGFITAYM